VVNVVERLFLYTRPEEAFFGEKDRQQLTLLRFIACNELWPVQVTGCPTVRAQDGLALSSRNARLNTLEREQATVLYRALLRAQELAFLRPVDEVIRAATSVIASAPGVILDYFGIADHDDLAPVASWGDRDRAVALVAAQVGPVRLIDNLTLVR
jgi:pantoate--beta-alanine ligase